MLNAEGSSVMSQRAVWWGPILLLAVIGTLLVLGYSWGIGERLGNLRDWIKELGIWGPVVFILIYAATAVAAIPGTLWAVAAGALFGSLLGVILVSIASTLGASLAFLVARYLARDAIIRWLSTKERFRRMDRLTAKHGAIIVGLTRLVPLFPYNLLNYGFGLTGIPFRTYLFWSWLCMLPGTVLYVAGADAVYTGLTRGEVPWKLIGAIAVTGAVLTLLIRYARHRLSESEAQRQNDKKN